MQMYNFFALSCIIIYSKIATTNTNVRTNNSLLVLFYKIIYYMTHQHTRAIRTSILKYIASIKIVTSKLKIINKELLCYNMLKHINMINNFASSKSN